jgi:hypothetical protein
MQKCNCPQHHGLGRQSTLATHSGEGDFSSHVQHVEHVTGEDTRYPLHSGAGSNLFTAPTEALSMSDAADSPNRYPYAERGISSTSGQSQDDERGKWSQKWTAMTNYFSTAAADRFDDTDFKRGEASNYPEIPAEEWRNRNLEQIRKDYNPLRDEAGNATPLQRQRSFTGSTASGRGPDDGVATPRLEMSQLHQDSLAYPNPAALRSRINSLPVSRRSTDPRITPASAGSVNARPQPRRATHDGPSQFHPDPTQYTPPPQSSILVNPRGLISPAIMVIPSSPAPSPAPSRRASLTDDSPPSPAVSSSSDT